MKTVAIIGLGARGYHTYAKYQHLHLERMKIVAIADPIREKVDLVRREFGIPEEGCFGSAEELLSKGKLADVLFVCTQDRQHKDHAVKGMRLGYDLLLEKPIATNPRDVLEILDAALADNWDLAADSLQHHLELARDKAEGVIKVIRLW